MDLHTAISIPEDTDPIDTSNAVSSSSTAETGSIKKRKLENKTTSYLDGGRSGEDLAFLPATREGDDDSNNHTIDDHDYEVAWTEQHHEDFVGAIFDIGLRQSSPSVLLEHMSHAEVQALLNSERVKSKLQKYRKNKAKSKQDFMDEYHSFLQRVKLMGGSRFTDPTSLIHMMGPEDREISGGDIAGYLTLATLGAGDQNKKTNFNSSNKRSNTTKTNHLFNTDVEDEGMLSHDTILSSQSLQSQVADILTEFAGKPIPFPVLSETEKKSPLGMSMAFVMGLFFSMQQQLAKAREARGEHAKKLRLTSATEPLAATVAVAEMLSTTATGLSTASCTSAGDSAIATKNGTHAHRIFPGKDFIVPSSAPQSEIYSALTSFLRTKEGPSEN